MDEDVHQSKGGVYVMYHSVHTPTTGNRAYHTGDGLPLMRLTLSVVCRGTTKVRTSSRLLPVVNNLHVGYTRANSKPIAPGPTFITLLYITVLPTNLGYTIRLTITPLSFYRRIIPICCHTDHTIFLQLFALLCVRMSMF
jgi:hypothetical protein